MAGFITSTKTHHMKYEEARNASHSPALSFSVSTNVQVDYHDTWGLRTWSPPPRGSPEDMRKLIEGNSVILRKRLHSSPHSVNHHNIKGAKISVHVFSSHLDHFLEMLIFLGNSRRPFPQQQPRNCMIFSILSYAKKP